jgi:hypothetical protein
MIVLCDRLACRVQIHQDPLASFLKFDSRLRWTDAAWASAQEADTKAGLKAPDPTAEDRLGNAKASRSTDEAATLDHFDEAPKILKLNHSSVPPLATGWCRMRALCIPW